ncbi:hypothetical protein Q4567_22000 [Aliiglaciecola sp. 2_MG-2023]|uniref:hypothetical protein n=1 Tax=unclassified Aliiglaciecola TaxID=2593648 RepID=UPI0026E202C1|nr:MULTISPECIES: hypothetical protein [unclassified Aliiglaciecola]MDO6713413.1 hypothetical protein [Aliiglaciecola sp. 2_MG-2023]MDO6754547.1 hypothetical protein [Aliiglaciecola sp. 1_MG-2023]
MKVKLISLAASLFVAVILYMLLDSFFALLWLGTLGFSLPVLTSLGINRNAI